MTARRAQELDAQVAALGEEQRSLQSERQGMQAQVETLRRTLERERELAANAADAGSEFPEEVADGLESLAFCSEQLNQQLSLARAEAIRDRLVAAGVEPQRIHAHGAVAPAAGQAPDADGWALQRRVDIRLERRTGQLAARP